MKLKQLSLSLLIGGLIVSGPTQLAAAAATPLDLARQLNRAFVAVAKKVSPSVVVIQVTQKVETPRQRQMNPFFEYFREQFPDRFREMPETPEEFKRQGQGSGVIIREDGYIATNSHVVENADKVTVILHDGTRYEGKIRGVDPQSDLAVVKIDAENLPTSKFADSDQTEVGEFAIAIGAPYELDYSVTIGHVSAKGRATYSLKLVDQDFIQTDASINPGNSGGPLVNLDGDIIGINTMIRGIGTGIGFAIPANLANDITRSLIDHGKVVRAWLGIGIDSLRENATLRQNFPDLKDGVVVMGIEPEAPASKSDLAAGDVILKVDGASVTSVQGLKDEIRFKKIGEPMRLEVSRDGKKVVVKVSPGVRPSQEEIYRSRTREIERPEAALGITIETINPRTKRQFNLDVESGVLVTDVAEDSIASRYGISPGDVITDINRRSVENANDFRKVLRDADLDDGVVLKIISDGSRKLRVLRAE